LLQQSEEILKYEGMYTISGDFGDEDYYGPGVGRCYDIDFQIKFFIGEGEKIYVRVPISHSVVHDNKNNYDYEQDGYPLEQGECILEELDDKCYRFTLGNGNAYSRYRDGDYTVVLKNDEITVANNSETYHAKKVK